MEEAVAHLGQHEAEGVLEGDDVPELDKVLLLALVRQRLLVRRLLRVHSLRQLLSKHKTRQNTLSYGLYFHQTPDNPGPPLLLHRNSNALLSTPRSNEICSTSKRRWHHRQASKQCLRQSTASARGATRNRYWKAPVKRRTLNVNPQVPRRLDLLRLQSTSKAR